MFGLQTCQAHCTEHNSDQDDDQINHSHSSPPPVMAAFLHGQMQDWQSNPKTDTTGGLFPAWNHDPGTLS
jgi:hypothetical protein